MASTTRSKNPVTLASTPRPRIYRIAGGFLFVPTLDMWNVHEAGKLFRGQETTIRAIVDKAVRSEEKMEHARSGRYHEHVSVELVGHWRRQFKEHPWFEPWLLRGEPLPRFIKPVPVELAQRCHAMWDFTAICNDAEIDNSTYVLWFRNRLISGIPLLKWLFGDPEPDQIFVVSRKLQRLREEMTRGAILKAAGLTKSMIHDWKKGQRTRGPIEAILKGDKSSDASDWQFLQERTQVAMKKVEKAASLTKCLKRAELTWAALSTAERRAKLCGVLDELWKYLRMEEPYNPHASRLAISERTLWGLAQTGEIRAIKLGRLVRYSLAELEAWVTRRTEQAEPLPFPGSDKAAV